MNNKANINSTWKKIKEISGKYSAPEIPAININETLTSNPQDVANTLAETFASVSEHTYHREFIRYKERVEQRPVNFATKLQCQYNVPITMKELQAALSTIAETSAGKDRITHVMIKKCHRSMIEAMLNLYNNFSYTHIYTVLKKVNYYTYTKAK